MDYICSRLIMTMQTLIRIIFLISIVFGQQNFGDSRQNAITQTIQTVSPSIASINVTLDAYNPFARDPFFEYFFPGRKSKREIQSTGSGVVISPDGYLLTNYHVIENAKKVMVNLPGGKEYNAEIIGTDYITDLALLKLEGQNFPYAQLGDSEDIIIGERVIALGNPFGLFDISKQPLATAGIISAVDMDFGSQHGRVYKDMIQTDAAINRGNSGGPLVNSRGQVIGINTFIYTGSAFAEGSVGIGFAIPINLAKEIADQLKLTGKVDRSFSTGLTVERLTSEVVLYLDVPFNHGVIVVDVEPGSNGAEAGVVVGDIIYAVNNQKVSSSLDILKIIKDSDLRSGSQLNLMVYREGNNITIELTLARMN